MRSSTFINFQCERWFIYQAPKCAWAYLIDVLINCIIKMCIPTVILSSPLEPVELFNPGFCTLLFMQKICSVAGPLETMLAFYMITKAFPIICNPIPANVTFDAINLPDGFRRRTCSTCIGRFCDALQNKHFRIFKRFAKFVWMDSEPMFAVLLAMLESFEALFSNFCFMVDSVSNSGQFYCVYKSDRHCPDWQINNGNANKIKFK